jgi:MtN3 and saliva related transmembrane protein
MDVVVIIGLVAAVLTSLSGIPQLIQAFKTKSTKDLSFGMIIMLTIGFTLWLIYGVITKDIPIITANVITMAIGIPILILKFKYK